MKINGVEVPDAEIKNACAAMKCGPFTCAILANKIDHQHAYRIADRLLQRERKAGNIVFLENKYWVWVGQPKT